MKKVHILVFCLILLTAAQVSFHYLKATDEKTFNVLIMAIECCAILVMTVMSLSLPRLAVWWLVLKAKKNPNRFSRYWLDSERKDQTLAYFSNFCILSIAIAMLFLIAVLEVALNDKLPIYGIFIALAMYMILEFLILGVTIVKFRRIPEAEK